MNYRLEKIAMEKSSNEPYDTIDDVKIGSTILVGRNMYQMIKTSPIVEILQKTEDIVMFKTHTSTYLLEKIND